MDSNELYQKQIADKYGEEVLEEIQDCITYEMDSIVRQLQKLAYELTSILANKIIDDLELDDEYRCEIAHIATCHDLLNDSIWEVH
jgi:hypothetical protein